MKICYSLSLLTFKFPSYNIFSFLVPREDAIPEKIVERYTKEGYSTVKGLCTTYLATGVGVNLIKAEKDGDVELKAI